jgi:hypothetical protein
VGLLELGPVVLAPVLAAAVTWRWLAPPGNRGGHRPLRERAAEPGWGTPIEAVLAVLAGAAVFAEWAALTVQSYDVGIRGLD